MESTGSMKRWWMVGALLLFGAACSANVSNGAPSEDEEVAETTLACGHAPVRKAVQLESGIELAYVEQGRTPGPPVILLHGYTDSHHSFDLTLPRLSRALHVYALDQRGHGDSSRPDCCYTQQDFAGDVIAFMDALGIARASLVGHSMGSFIAQSVALLAPERVATLVLIGSAPTVAGNEGAAELASIVATLEDPIDPEFVRAFQAGTFYRPIPESFLDTAVEESLKVPAAIWKSALTGLIEEDHSQQLGSLAAPTLILYGDQDGFFSLEDQYALETAIPDASLIVFPETGHGTHVELPRRVARHINRFLRRR